MDGELALTPEEQAIADKAQGKHIEEPEGDDIELPSDKPKEGEEDKKFAGKYDTVEDLRKGIDSIGSDLPEYVLEGMSDEALEKHYQELQKDFHEEKSGRKHSDDKEDKDDEEPEDKDERPEGVSPELWTDLSTYFEENGNITDEHYDQLNKAGIPDEVIDNYIDGIQMKQEAFTQDIYNIAGSQEEFETMKAWAEENYPAEQLDAISKMDKAGMIMAMKGIKADYLEQNPSDGKRILGETRGTSVGSYRDQSDYIIDVSDSRYGVDKRYTKMVNDKFANSKHLQ